MVTDKSKLPLRCPDCQTTFGGLIRAGDPSPCCQEPLQHNPSAATFLGVTPAALQALDKLISDLSHMKGKVASACANEQAEELCHTLSDGQTLAGQLELAFATLQTEVEIASEAAEPEPKEKPPLEIQPMTYWLDDRVMALLAAIRRRIELGRFSDPVVAIWIREIAEHSATLTRIARDTAEEKP